MREVNFTPDAWDEMWAHVNGSVAEEVVGALLGTIGSHEVKVLVAMPLANMAMDKVNGYEVDPVQMCLLWDSVDQSDGPETVVGFYHSHPFTDAEPSEADWEMAHPGYSYVICSLKNKDAKTFVLGDGSRELRFNGRQ